jgi:signal transduction histidine kinase/ligand-binding sensor domain-containing protein
MMKGINYNNVRWLVSMLTVLFTIHCSLFTASTAHAQGIPYIRNYTAEEYHGNNNNYDIDIDENGNIFVANFEGLMYYDHAQWRIIRTPGITRVTVVYRSTSNTIWVGGYNYFGRIMTKENGELALTRVGKPELFRGEVTEIYEQGGKLMFFVNNGSIYEVDGNKVTLMKSIDKNRVRIGMMDVIDINALDNEGAELVKNDTVETEELDNGLSAIIRKNNGMQIADENTGKSFYITDKNGLCSNNVTYTAYNERGQLWGTTAKGVFSMQVPSAYSRFTHYEGLTGEVLSILKVDGTMYVGTDDGLFRLNGRQFEHVTSVKYACWDMKKSSQGGLLAATAEGVFRILPNGQSKQLSIRTATALLEDGQDIYCGEQNGVYLMGPNGQGKRKVSGLENVRKIFKDNNGTIWLQSLYGEVWYKKTDAKLFSHYRIKSKTETMSTFVVTGQEVKVVSVEDTKPFPYPLFSYTDEKDVTWLTDNEGKNLYRWKDGKRLTDMDQLLFPIHETIVRTLYIQDNQIWLGSDNGVTVIDTQAKDPMLDIKPQLHIRSVVLNSDSVLWGGFGAMPEVLSDLNHSENNLSFTYSLTYTPIVGKSLYRYRMDNGKWSTWSVNTHASFTNVPDGSHSFSVQARDAMNRQSEIVSIRFYITPPFYRQWYMYLLYALVLAALVYAFVQLRLRRLEKDKMRLERIVQDRTAEVVKQKDEIEEKSKSLETALHELGEAQNELIRQEKMATVGKLTQGLIDRILNPLNYINNFAKLSEGLVKDIEANIEDDKDNMDSENYEDTIDVLGMLQGNLQKVGEHGQNTTRTLKAMEEMLKDRSGGIVKMDLARVLRQDEEMIRTYFAKDIDEHQIQVSFDLPTGELPINGNAEQLSKTLMSMLGNSIYALIKKVQRVKFQPEVRLTAKAVGDCVQLSVYDNGIGIEETIINKVFDPFFTTKPTGEASGVGLYLSREIIQNHGGDISVKSVKDEYSEFIITLPALTV